MFNDLEVYFSTVADTVKNLNEQDYKLITKEIINSVKKGKTIFLLGSGPSSTITEHFTNDLTKMGSINIASRLGVGIKVISITSNMPLLTALSNDISYEDVYKEYLIRTATSDDVLIIFSEGNPHTNIIEAARYAFEHGIKVIVLGSDDCEVFTEHAHYIFYIPSDEPSVINDIQMFLCHSITKDVKDNLKLPVVFLDRDGVINEDREGYVKNLNEFRFKQDAASSIKRLNEAGFTVVVVTNQAGINKQIVSQKDLDEIHNSMSKQLKSKGAWISEIYYCPHTPTEQCNCRKPRTGLLDKAIKELPIDSNYAYMIGDRITDVIAGNSAGIKTVLISEDESFVLNEINSPNHIAKDLTSSVNWILSHHKI